VNCIEFSADLLPDLTRLVNAQLAAVPPGWSLTETQAAQTLAQASDLWGVHFPEQKAVFELETLCVLDRGRLTAAAQWGFPIVPETRGIDNASVLFWIAAEPTSAESLPLLLETLAAHSRAAGSPRITTTRFSFGVGWLGIPALWTHVTEGLQAAGFAVTRRWVILACPASLPEVPAPESIRSMNISWQVDENASEWDFRLHADGELVGECSAWGIPQHFSGSEGYANWITVEWLGVEPAYQRKGIGRWLVAEQLRRQAGRGISKAILWTETNNQALAGLGESLGFQTGPECWEFELVNAKLGP
jgi:GNAT superfamily N-acetyltransferase